MVYFLIGLPEGGQTAWVRGVEATAKPLILRPREFVQTYAREHQVSPALALALVDPLYVEAKMIAQMKAALEQGRMVVIDQGNMSAQERHRFLRHIHPQYPRVAVVFESNPVNAYHRLTRRNPNRVPIPWYVVERMMRRFEEPQVARNPLHRFWHETPEFTSIMRVKQAPPTLTQRMRFLLFSLRYRWSKRVPIKRDRTLDSVP